jgi:hypothetical protein
MNSADKQTQTIEITQSSSDVLFSIVIKTVITIVISGGLFWMIK